MVQLKTTTEKIPAREECISLMQKEGMLDNIVRHSFMVEKVAVFLANSLIQSGEKLNRKAIGAAALLHDITKTRSLHTHEDHALTGKSLLTNLGYPLIGKIIGCHVEIPSLTIKKSSVSNEEVINYADKRVLHDTIVTLTKRFDDIHLRYGINLTNSARLKRIENKSFCIEKKIFSKINLTPSTLNATLCDI